MRFEKYILTVGAADVTIGTASNQCQPKFEVLHQVYIGVREKMRSKL